MFDTHEELLDTYRATPQTLRALIRNIDTERARRRPNPESWSVVEVVAHLGDTEERAHERVKRMAVEDNPLIEGYDEAALAEERRYREMDLADALGRFEAQRAAQIATLEGYSADDWVRPARHNEIGDITVESLTAHMVAHDAIHLAQIARILLDEPGA